MFWRAKDTDVTEVEAEDALTTEDSEELTILKIVEIIVKDSQLTVKELKNYVEQLTTAQETIKELKAEIKQLKAELQEEKVFTRSLVNKLIDRPSSVANSAPSALASRLGTSGSGTNSNSSTVGPKGKLP